MTLAIFQPEDDRYAGCWQDGYLGDDGIYERCRSNIIRQVEEAERAEVSPVSEVFVVGVVVDKVVGICQLVVDKTVSLDPLGELVGFTANENGLASRVGHQSNLRSSYVRHNTSVGHDSMATQ